MFAEHDCVCGGDEQFDFLAFGLQQRCCHPHLFVRKPIHRSILSHGEPLCNKLVGICERRGVAHFPFWRLLMQWLRDRALTLVLMAMFMVFLAGQLVAGFYEYNANQRDHGAAVVSPAGYMATGHPWEAIFENWESEFLQMAVFVLLTTVLVQKGSPESRRPGVKELVDADPRDFADEADVPWPVKRGGWVLRLYENSLGLVFVLLFLVSWAGHALGSFAEYADDQLTHGRAAPSFGEYLRSSRFWFESFQNWQSEFLAIASMVWLAVYLRQRWSPESKPVHAPHGETGR